MENQKRRMHIDEIPLIEIELADYLVEMDLLAEEEELKKKEEELERKRQNL